MKRLALLLTLLIPIFTFGQTTELKNKENSWKFKVERQLKGLEQDDIKDWQGHLFQKNRNFLQNSSLKSSQDIKQRLDSILSQNWDETTSQWVVSDKQKFTYDDNGNNTNYLYYFWDETTSQWVASIKYEYTYDANGNMTQFLFYGWDETTSQWVADWKYEYTYDGNGNITQSLSYLWDETTSQWIASSKIESTYDGNGNITQSLSYLWDESTSEWNAADKYEYTYDANGNRTQELVYNWDESTSEWITHRKYEYTYDTNGNRTQDIYYRWDLINNQWVTDWKYEYTYDANGNRMQDIYYDWDETTSLWVVKEKIESTFDENGNMTHYIKYNWDETTSQWIADWKVEYTHDNSYSYSDLILPYIYNMYMYNMYAGIKIFNHMLTDLLNYNWDETLSDWVSRSKRTYYYSEQDVSSITEITGTELNVYPNPFTTSTTIEYELINPETVTITFYNQFGKQVDVIEEQQQRGLNSIEWTPENLAGGIYYFRLQAGDQVASGNVVLMK